MSPSPDRGYLQAEYRPYWQILLLGAILALAGYAGAHVPGEPWRAPELSIFLFALIVVLLCLLLRMLRLGRIVLPLLHYTHTEEPIYENLERISWPFLGFVGVSS